jgi:H+/gluconate symporter-like permease
MTTALGIIGILLAFLLVIFGTYKGYNLAYLVIVGCLLILVTNGLPVLETFSGTVMEGVASQVPTLLPLYVLGAIFGKLFIDSGAAFSLSNAMLNLFGRNATPAVRRLIGGIIIVLMDAIMNFVGIDPFASLFTMIAIATGMMSATDIPRRYMPVYLVLGSAVGSMMPGSIATPNILLQNILGVGSMSGFIPGLVSTAFVLVASFTYIQKMIKKDVDKGAHFEYGPLEPANLNGDHMPHPLLGLASLLIIIVCFNVLGLAAWASMGVGVVAALILLARYIPVPEGGNHLTAIRDSLNDGTTIAGIPAITLMSYCLGYAIEATDSFQVIVTFFTSLPGPALFSLAIMGTLLLGVAASASGLILSASIAVSTFIPNFGLSAAACFRVLAGTNVVLDSLPFAGAIVAMMAITGIKYKEGYPPIAMTTVVFTFLGLLISTALLVLFPGLA